MLLPSKALQPNWVLLRLGSQQKPLTRARATLKSTLASTRSCVRCSFEIRCRRPRCPRLQSALRPGYRCSNSLSLSKTGRQHKGLDRYNTHPYYMYFSIQHCPSCPAAKLPDHTLVACPVRLYASYKSSLLLAPLCVH